MRALALAAVTLLLHAGPALAQEPADPPTEAPKIQAPGPDPSGSIQIGLALGPGLDVIVPTSGTASVAVVPRVSIRFPSDSGWSPTVGFGWFDTGIDGAQLGPEQRIGVLQLRPVMFGARYTWVRGEYSFDVAATAGPSFSDFDIDGDVARANFGSREVRAEASTSLASKVQGGVWYDYNDRIAFRGTVGYFRCAPDVTITADGASRRFKQPAHAIQLGASVVYRIF